MKKATAIFFLLFFGLSQTAHVIAYYIQKWQIEKRVRQEILAGIPDRYLQVFEYTKSLQWEEEGKEFKLNNEFYDVVKRKIVNGRVFLYCLNDKNEETILNNYTKAIGNAVGAEQGKSKYSFKYQLLDPFLESPVIIIAIKPLVAVWFSSFKDALLSCYRKIILPPPRAIL